MIVLFQLLAIVGSATFAGVMIAIALILGPIWRAMPPADFLAWFGANSGTIARTIPLVVVPALVGVVGAIALSGRDKVARWLWVTAFGAILALLALTAAFFLPLNAAFTARTIALAEVPGRIEAWLAMHWVRIGLALAASGLGVVAVARGAARGHRLQ